MSDYTQATDFSVKDGLATGNPSKKILGAEVDAELALIAAAIATKSEQADIDAFADLLIDTGSFEVTLTGVSSDPVTGDLTYYKIGNIVALTAQSAITGTSDTNAFTMTGVPTALWPNAVQRNASTVTNNGATRLGYVSLSTAGVLSFALGDPPSLTGFTTSGTKGVAAGWSLVYSI